ncbi:3'-5' DNA helicase [Ceratobasidium sp. 395]|nr:3'-5' DNA helicase [Ceratobasidium sp. 395]
MAQTAESPRLRGGSPQDTKPDTATLSLLDGAEKDEEFTFPDGNIHIRAESCVFFVHKYKLLKFRKIEKMVREHDEIMLNESAVDFRNVLRVLYVSFDSMTRFNPDSSTLIPALRLATKYDYPDLRIFSIQQLDAKSHSPLDYLAPACEFDVQDWKEPALNYLVSRDGPITEAEAEILGMKLYVATVGRREERLVQQCKSLQSQIHPEDDAWFLPDDPLGGLTLPLSSSGQNRCDSRSSSPDPINMDCRFYAPAAKRARQTTSFQSVAPRVSGTSSGHRDAGEFSMGPVFDLMQPAPAHGAPLAAVRPSKNKISNHTTTARKIQGYGKGKTAVGGLEREDNKGLEQSSGASTSDVSLPTDFGKTFIAGCIMLNFYTWFPTGKIVFIAPTESLVTQQIESCHGTCGIPGRAGIDLTNITQKAQRRRAWEERRVFYTTPHAFLDDLVDGTSDVRDVVLVVFDEAHLATGAYSYVLAAQLLVAKNPYHRVLALSATLGKESESIQDVVDALHISRVDIQDEHSADLQKYLFKRIDVQIVEMNLAITSIKASLVAMMRPLLVIVQAAGCCEAAEPEGLEPSDVRRVKNNTLFIGGSGSRIDYALECLVDLAWALMFLVMTFGFHLDIIY